MSGAFLFVFYNYGCHLTPPGCHPGGRMTSRGMEILSCESESCISGFPVYHIHKSHLVNMNHISKVVKAGE